MQIGEFIVYPGQGVGRITAIEERFIAGTPSSFFNVHILETEDQILIPVDRVADCGVRALVSTNHASTVVQIFSEPPADWAGISWIRRSRHYGSSLMEGQLHATAEVEDKVRELVEKGEAATFHCPTPSKALAKDSKKDKKTQKKKESGGFSSSGNSSYAGRVQGQTNSTSSMSGTNGHTCPIKRSPTSIRGAHGQGSREADAEPDFV